MSVTVLSLKVGDILADRDGVLGKVFSFTRDAAVIEWDDNSKCSYSDADLRERGAVLVDGSRE